MNKVYYNEHIVYNKKEQVMSSHYNQNRQPGFPALQSRTEKPEEVIGEITRTLSLSELKKEIDIASGQNNGQTAHYRKHALILNKTLRVDDGLAKLIVFKTLSERNGMSTFLSQYGREELHCYENGWRFQSRTVMDGERFGIWVWKVKSNMAEKEQRSHKHKK